MLLARTSLSIWRAVCQTVKAIRCRRVSVSSRSGVSASLKLLFAVSCRVSPQRQQFARNQTRDRELLFELVIGAQDRGLYVIRNFHIFPIRQMTSALNQSNSSDNGSNANDIWHQSRGIVRIFKRLHRHHCV